LEGQAWNFRRCERKKGEENNSLEPHRQLSADTHLTPRRAWCIALNATVEVSGLATGRRCTRHLKSVSIFNTLAWTSHTPTLSQLDYIYIKKKNKNIKKPSTLVMFFSSKDKLVSVLKIQRSPLIFFMLLHVIYSLHCD